MLEEESQSSAVSGESSATFLKLNEYLSTAIPDDASDDDAATVITNMVSETNSTTHEDQNESPEENLAPVATSFSDDGSVDLVYSGMRNIADRSVTSSSSGGSGSSKQRKPLTPRTPSSASSAKVKITKKKSKGGMGLTKDISLDVVLQRLSKVEPEVALPPKAAWESKVKYLAGQIDMERDNGMKLTDIEKMLEVKKVRAKQDTEQAKWKSRVRDLEAVLEERRKVKDEKLRKLAVILESLKKEKAEMKKYEKVGGGSKWASKSNQYNESVPNRPGGPDRSASLVRTSEPRTSRRTRK